MSENDAKRKKNEKCQAFDFLYFLQTKYELTVKVVQSCQLLRRHFFVFQVPSIWAFSMVDDVSQIFKSYLVKGSYTKGGGFKKDKSVEVEETKKVVLMVKVAIPLIIGDRKFQNLSSAIIITSNVKIGLQLAES